MRAHHRLSKLLLRHGLRFRRVAWSKQHLLWLDRVELGQPGSRLAYWDCREAVEVALARRVRTESEIERLLVGSLWEQTASRLRCLRGVSTLTAAGLCAEIGDFERFARPGAADELPRPGSLRVLDGIEPPACGDHESGSVHTRRLLVETAWHYRRHPAVGVKLRPRQEGQPSEAISIAWAAQRRGHHVRERMQERGKRRTLIAVVVELAGFCWAISAAAGEAARPGLARGNRRFRYERRETVKLEVCREPALETKPGPPRAGCSVLPT